MMSLSNHKKGISYCLLILAALLLTLGSCSKDKDKDTAVEPTLTCTLDNASLAAVGASQSISIVSNTGWTASSNQSWCTLSATTGNGNASLSLTAAPNTGATPRTAVITITAGTLSQTVTIVQGSPLLELVLSPSTTFAPTGGVLTATVTATNSWTISSSESWCTPSTTTGSGNASFSVTAEPNTGTAARTAIITITAGTLSQAVTITQGSPLLELVLSPSAIFPTTGGVLTATVSASNSWTVGSSESWCTLSTTTGSGDASFSVTAEPNTGATSRTATITITAGMLSQTLTVTQAPVTFELTLLSGSTSLTSSGGSLVVSVTSNADWTASTNATWCHLSAASGSNNGTLSITVDANDGNSSRTATLTVTAAGISKTLTISQSYVAVYVVGYQGKTAMLWKNGVAFPFGQYGSDSHKATGIALAGNDVYVSGYSSAAGAAYSDVAGYWKNGNFVTLFNNGSTSKAQATAIVVVGNDVHVAGRRRNDGRSQAMYWKNGVGTTLDNYSSDTYAYAIVVAGRDAYTVGEDYSSSTTAVAMGWKSDTKFFSTTQSPGIYNTARGVAVVDNNVYIVGSTQNNSGVNRAVCWKNNTRTDIDVAGTTAMAVTVADNNVMYVAGSKNSKAIYWTNLLGAWIPTELSGGTQPTEGLAIATIGNNVYVAGHTDNRHEAVYWKNGVLVRLATDADPSGGAVATGIAVREEM